MTTPELAVYGWGGAPKDVRLVNVPPISTARLNGTDPATLTRASWPASVFVTAGYDVWSVPTDPSSWVRDEHGLPGDPATGLRTVARYRATCKEAHAYCMHRRTRLAAWDSSNWLLRRQLEYDLQKPRSGAYESEEAYELSFALMGASAGDPAAGCHAAQHTYVTQPADPAFPAASGEKQAGHALEPGHTRPGFPGRGIRSSVANGVLERSDPQPSYYHERGYDDPFVGETFYHDSEVVQLTGGLRTESGYQFVCERILTTSTSTTSTTSSHSTSTTTSSSSSTSTWSSTTTSATTLTSTTVTSTSSTTSSSVSATSTTSTTTTSSTTSSSTSSTTTTSSTSTTSSTTSTSSTTATTTSTTTMQSALAALGLFELAYLGAA